MKIGDRVYCKKDVNDGIIKDLSIGMQVQVADGGKEVWFYQGNFYKIIQVSELWVNIETDIVLGYPTKKISVSFITKDTSGVYNGDLFKDYFYTEKELRLLKLEQLG